MPRKVTQSLSDVNEKSNRQLLVDMAIKLHEMDKKLDTHLAIHAVIVKLGMAAVTIAGVAAAWLKLR